MGKEDARADSRKRLRESGSQTDGEDAFDEADGHCRGTSAKLDEVSEKLDKVLTRLGELEAMQGRVAELEKENNNNKKSNAPYYRKLKLYEIKVLEINIT